MELVSIRIEESPHAAGRVRLVGDVAYDDRPGTEAYWLEVDEEYAGSLSLSGSPWLAWLLPLAALAVGAIAVAFLVWTWTRGRGPEAAGEAEPLDPQIERLVDEELARFDA